MMNRRNWCSTSSAIVATNQNYLSSCLCNTCCNCTNASFTNKLYRNARSTVSIFQIVNKLGKIFNRINIVMWWWRNQRNTRSCKTSLCNPRINLFTRKMTSFSRLCSLCHFNLNFTGTQKIFFCNTKTSRSYLLDCTVIFCSKSLRLFTTFTTV